MDAVDMIHFRKKIFFIENRLHHPILHSRNMLYSVLAFHRNKLKGLTAAFQNEG